MHAGSIWALAETGYGHARGRSLCPVLHDKRNGMSPFALDCIADQTSQLLVSLSVGRTCPLPCLYCVALAIQTTLVLQWGCDDLEEKVRASILETSGTERVGVWEWKLSSFSQVVKVLVTTEQTKDCDVVGRGAGGPVKA